MRSSKEIMKRINDLETIIGTMDESIDEAASIELMGVELQALRWSLYGPDKYSYDEVKKMLENYMGKDADCLETVLYILAREMK